MKDWLKFAVDWRRMVNIRRVKKRWWNGKKKWLPIAKSKKFGVLQISLFTRFFLLINIIQQKHETVFIYIYFDWLRAQTEACFYAT